MVCLQKLKTNQHLGRDMKVTIEQYRKYKKQTGCSYPFQEDGIDYCWGYAHAVDRGLEMDCTDCEFLTN